MFDLGANPPERHTHLGSHPSQRDVMRIQERAGYLGSQDRLEKRTSPAMHHDQRCRRARQWLRASFIVKRQRCCGLLSLPSIFSASHTLSDDVRHRRTRTLTLSQASLLKHRPAPHTHGRSSSTSTQRELRCDQSESRMHIFRSSRCCSPCQLDHTTSMNQ